MTLTLRPARSTDAGKIGEILHQFEVETPWMPKQHSGAQAISFCGIMIDRGWVTVAADETRVLGFLALSDDEICGLYVGFDHCGQGIGKALLDFAKSQRQRLSLWTFQDNQGAQRFYEREGFTEEGRTDGANNPERLPDIAYRWIQPGTEKPARPKSDDTPATGGKKPAPAPVAPSADVSNQGGNKDRQT